MRENKRFAQSDLDNDFEYNFDLNPFNFIIDTIHWLVVTPVKVSKYIFNWASARLHRIQADQNYRRTFKGPVCMLK